MIQWKSHPPRQPERPPLVRLIWDDLQAGNMTRHTPPGEDPTEWAATIDRWLEIAEHALFMDVTVAGRLNAAHGSEFLLRDMDEFSHLPPLGNMFFEMQRGPHDSIVGHLAHCGPFGVSHGVHLLTSKTDDGFRMSLAYAVRWAHGEPPVFPVGATIIELDPDGKVLMDGQGRPRWLDTVLPYLDEGTSQCIWSRQVIWTEAVLFQLAMLNGYVFPKSIRAQLGVTQEEPQGAVHAELLSERQGDANEHRAVIASLVRANRLRENDPHVSITDRMVARAFSGCEESLEYALDGWATFAEARDGLRRMGDLDTWERLAPIDELMLEVVDRHVALRGLGQTPGIPDQVRSAWGGVHLTVEHVGPNVRRLVLQGSEPSHA
jgi:hypothetical protein